MVNIADGGDEGTTSACAENTGATPTANHESWNYLRVRGEYRKPGGLVKAKKVNYLRVRGEYT